MIGVATGALRALRSGVMRTNPFIATLVVAAGAGLIGAVFLALGASDTYDVQAAVAMGAWSDTLLLVAFLCAVGALVIAGVRWQPSAAQPRPEPSINEAWKDAAPHTDEDGL